MKRRRSSGGGLRSGGLGAHGAFQNPDQGGEDEERARRHRQQSPRAPGRTGDGQTPERAGAQHFSDCGDQEKDVGIAQAGGESIEGGKSGRVGKGERFGASHDNTVCDDEADVGTELSGDFGRKGAEEDIEEEDNGGDDQHFAHHSDTRRDAAAQKGDENVGEYERVEDP